MFKIGEFSKLSQASVKTLRYYDQIGLLQPARIDRFTSYRYYSADQLPRLNRILALKDLGLTLEQIGGVMSEELSASELRGMLRMKQAELQQDIEQQQARLARVAARLRQIEQEATMPAYEVVLKEVPALRVAPVRGVIPNYSSQGELWGELEGYLAQQSVRPTGPCLTLYHDEEYKEADVDVEVCEPIVAALAAGGRVQVHELCAGTMASLILHGSYDQFNDAYTALMTWIMQNGYRITGPNREIYVRNAAHGVPPSEFVTEIQFPVAKQ